MQPILIAEEMDLDPGQFEIRFAGPSPAYFNSGFADEFAPFVAADQSPAAAAGRFWPASSPAGAADGDWR